MATTGGPCSDVIKFGYVEFKSKHIKTLRKRWLVLYGGAWSAPRLVKYTDEKQAKQCPDGRHIYYITDVISVERGKDHTVKIRFASDEREIFFSCDSEAGANDWVYHLQKSMSGSRDVFNVDLFQATHLNAPRDVTIRIADAYVTLIKDGVQFLEIPMATIRKYQMDKDNVFWIETGRSCPLGEGFLYFRSELAQYVLTRLHELASRGGERRPSLPDTSSRPSNTHPSGATIEPRRPSLPATPSHYSVESHVKPTSTDHLMNPYETAVPHPARCSHPGPTPQEYSPFPRKYPGQGPRAEFSRYPLSKSLGRIHEGREAGLHSERGQGFGDPEKLSQSFGGLQRRNTGSRLVAAARPNLPPRDTTEHIPYMAMQSKGSVDLPGRNDDYLTPFSTRTDAKHYGEKRNS